MIKKYNLFETIIILIILLMLGLVCIDIGNETVPRLVFSMLIISLSGGVRIVSNQDLTNNNKCVLHGMATYYFYSAMLCLFVVYIEELGEHNAVNSIYIWLTTALFSITVPSAVICKILKNREVTILRNIFAICFFIEICIVGIIHDNWINRESIIVIIYVLLGVSKIMYFLIGKMIKELNTTKGISYYNLFLLYNMLEYISLIVIRDKVMVSTIILGLQTIEIYCILRSGDKNWRGEDVSGINSTNETGGGIGDSDELDKIIVNLSHELKTPVNIIKSALDLLMLDCKDNELEYDIINTKDECKKIMSVIQLMIDVEKLKTGTYIVKYKLYNMVAVVENVIDAVRSEYPTTNILFNPAMEEIFSRTDLKLFQEALSRLLVTIIDKFNISIVYIEMNSRGVDKIQIKLYSEHVNQVGELLDGKEDIKYKDDIGSMLSVQYFTQVLDLTKGDIRYLGDSRNNCIEIILPITRDKKIEFENIDDNNVQELVEGIRYSYSMS